MNQGVTLTCSAKIDEDVTWKFQGASLMDSLFDYTEDAQQLNLPEVDRSMLGEYSCWRGDEMLSSTYLLLEESLEEGGHEESLEEGETLLIFHIFLIYYPNIQTYPKVAQTEWI